MRNVFFNHKARFDLSKIIKKYGKIWKINGRIISSIQKQRRT